MKAIMKRLYIGILIGCLSLATFSLTLSAADYSKSKIATSETDIRSIFPESYQDALVDLLKAHPNWSFQRLDTGLSWNELFAADNEGYPTRNLVSASMKKNTGWYSTDIGDAYEWLLDRWRVIEQPDWYQASMDAVGYCMDPRNFFNEEQIFQFLDYTEEVTLPLQAVQNVFNNVSCDFWTQTGEDSDLYDFNGDGEKIYLTYAEAVVRIAAELHVNPVTLATRIIQEQGAGASDLISGTKSFTLADGTNISGGYYNYFNIGATDASGDHELIVRNGLREAYEGGWNTRYKALKGGAEKFMSMYGNTGQVTVYLQKWNVLGGTPRVFWGQYMGNITAPQTETRNGYNSYKNADALESDFLFLIPVFSDMPESVVPAPIKDGNPNYKLKSLSINGYALKSFDYDTTFFEREISMNRENVTITVNAINPATMITAGGKSGKGSLTIQVDTTLKETQFVISTVAENGDRGSYTILLKKDPSIHWDEWFTGFVSKGNQRYYIWDGQWQENYTGLAQDPKTLTWYYVADGIVDETYTGLVQYQETWYYIQSGVLKWGETTLVLYQGTYYYVDNSTLHWHQNTLVKYGGTTYYVTNSKLEWGLNGFYHMDDGRWCLLENSALVEDYNTLYQYGDTWYYVHNGILNWGEVAMVPYKGTTYYVKNSTLQWHIDGLVEVGETWYLLENSKLQETYTGLTDYKQRTFYVQNGILIWGFNGLVKKGETYYYVTNSEVTYNVTTMVEFDGETYYIQNSELVWGVYGLVKVDGKLYYLENSMVKHTYTGLVPYENVLYYLKDGEFEPGVTGLMDYDGKTYYVQNSEVHFDVSGLTYIGNDWYYLQKSELQSDYSSLVLYQGTYYYVQNGVLNWGQNALVPYYSTTYYVQNSTLRWGVNGLTYIDGEWYYLQNSQLQKNYTGLVLYSGTNYYVQKGVLIWGENTLVLHNGTYYYVENSTLRYGKTTLVKYYSTTYYVQNSILYWGCTGLYHLDDGRWCLLNNSQLREDFTSLYQYGSTWYYIEKGMLNWGKCDLIPYYGTTYYVQNSTLRWGCTGLYHLDDGRWCLLSNSQLREDFNSLYQYGGTWYYIHNGLLNWGEEKVVLYQGTKFYVNNSTLTWGINKQWTDERKGIIYTLENSKVVDFERIPGYKGYTVVLDPGHCNQSAGADYGGVNEKEITLKVAKYCQEYIEENYPYVEVVLTRTDGNSTTSPYNLVQDLTDRVALARDLNADCLVSIHFNATGGHTATGVLSFVSFETNIAKGSKELGDSIISRISKEFGIANLGCVTTPSTEHPGHDYYGINRHAAEMDVVGIIVEHCFMDHDYNCYLTNGHVDDEKLKRFAICDAEGIMEYLESLD